MRQVIRPGRQILVCQNCADFVTDDENIGRSAIEHRCERKCLKADGVEDYCLCVCGEAG